MSCYTLLCYALQAKAEAERWEMRVNQLQEKYGKVDLEEYRRVETQLKELQASMRDSVPRSELEKVTAFACFSVAVRLYRLSSSHSRATRPSGCCLVFAIPARSCPLCPVKWQDYSLKRPRC